MSDYHFFCAYSYFRVAIKEILKLRYKPAWACLQNSWYHAKCSDTLGLALAAIVFGCIFGILLGVVGWRF